MTQQRRKYPNKKPSHADKDPQQFVHWNCMIWRLNEVDTDKQWLHSAPGKWSWRKNRFFCCCFLQLCICCPPIHHPVGQQWVASGLFTLLNELALVSFIFWHTPRGRCAPDVNSPCWAGRASNANRSRHESWWMVLLSCGRRSRKLISCIPFMRLYVITGVKLFLFPPPHSFCPLFFPVVTHHPSSPTSSLL